MRQPRPDSRMLDAEARDLVRLNVYQNRRELARSAQVRAAIERSMRETDDERTDAA